MSSTILQQAFLRSKPLKSSCTRQLNLIHIYLLLVASLKPVSRLGVQTTCFKSPVLGSLSGLHQQRSVQVPTSTSVLQTCSILPDLSTTSFFRFSSSKTLKCSEEDAIK
jgi:hypothetical protein